MGSDLNRQGKQPPLDSASNWWWLKDQVTWKHIHRNYFNNNRLVGAAMLMVGCSVRAATVAWPTSLPWQRAASRAGLLLQLGKPQLPPKPCQQVATSPSARAQWLEGQKLSHAPKAVLCYTPHTAEPVYIKPFLVFLSRKSAANRWRQMCLSRSVSQILT